LRITVVFNPEAGKNRKHPEWIERISSLLESGDALFVTTGVDKLPQLFSDLFVRPDAKPPDVLCFCGGDGTGHYMLTHLLQKVPHERIPPLCILPGGSMNTAIGTLGVKGDPVVLLTRVYRLVKEGGFPRVEVRRPLLINDKAGFIFGAGSALVMLEEYYSMPGETGSRRAAELAYRSIASVLTRGQLYKRFKEPIRASLAVDGRKLPHERYRTILAGTVEEIGLGFKMLYRASEDRTKFHLIASLIKPMKFLRQIRRMYVGQPLRGRGHHDMMASHVELVPDEKLRYLIDGELFETETPLTVRVGPPLKLLVP